MKNGLFIVIALAILAGCRPEQKADLYEPEIDTVEVNGNLSAYHLVAGNGEMEIRVKGTDNIALNQVKIDLVEVDYASPASYYGPNSGEFNFSQTINLDGTSFDQTITVDIPDSIAGFYYLQVALSDDIGYVVDYVTVVEIENEHLPVVSDVSSTPAANANGVIIMNEGTNLYYAATVNDLDGLASVKVHITNLDLEIQSTVDVPVSGTGISFTPNFDNAQAGHYFVVVEAIDLLGYSRLQGQHLIVN